MSELQSETQLSARKKVLVLVDWENLFLCLHEKFGADMRLEYRIQKFLEWIQSEIGELVGGYGFVFAPEHMSFLHREICRKNNLRLIICPKRQIEVDGASPARNEDTVDETLMWFGELMMRHQDVGFICLVSGDDDYVPFMEAAKKQDIKRALAPPTVDSLSKAMGLIRTADEHPITGKKMLLVLESLV